MKSFLKKLLSIFTEDFIPKLCILGISAFLWYHVNVLSIEQLSITLPVRLENVPEGMVAVPVDKPSVRVDLRSRENIEGKLGNLSAFIDLSQAKDGEFYQSISLDGIPEDVFASILPYTIRIDVDTIEQQSFPIRLKTKNENEKNYVVNYQMMPKEINVRGPSRKLKKIKELESEALDLRTLSDTVTNLPIKIKPIPYMELQTEIVTALLSVILEQSTNIIDVPVEVENIPIEKSLVNQPVAHVIVVSRITNPRILKEKVTASVKFPKLPKNGKVSLTPQFESSPDVRIISSDKSKLEFVFQDIQKE